MAPSPGGSLSRSCQRSRPFRIQAHQERVVALRDCSPFGWGNQEWRMTSPHGQEPVQRRMEVTREHNGWSIKVRDTNAETRHKPLSREEREVVHEEVRRGIATRGEEPALQHVTRRHAMASPLTSDYSGHTTTHPPRAAWADRARPHGSRTRSSPRHWGGSSRRTHCIHEGSRRRWSAWAASPHARTRGTGARSSGRSASCSQSTSASALGRHAPELSQPAEHHPALVRRMSNESQEPSRVVTWT